MYVHSGAHLYSLSEVIGHKLSKVVPLVLLLDEMKEYAVTIAIYTQLHLSLLLLFLGPSCTTKCYHRLTYYWLGQKSMQLCLSYSPPLHAPPSGGTHACKASDRDGQHGVVYIMYVPNLLYVPTQGMTVGLSVSSINNACSRPDPLL